MIATVSPALTMRAMAGEAGIEPATIRLTAERTAAVLLASKLVGAVGLEPTIHEGKAVFETAVYPSSTTRP